MPYKLIIYMENGDILEGPFVPPNNRKSEFGFEDRRTPKEIHKTGKSMIARLKQVKSYECKYMIPANKIKPNRMITCIFRLLNKYKLYTSKKPAESVFLPPIIKEETK